MADDPNKDIYGMLNARFVLKGDATVSPSGVVMAGTKLKVEFLWSWSKSTANGTVSGVTIQ